MNCFPDFPEAWGTPKTNINVNIVCQVTQGFTNGDTVPSQRNGHKTISISLASQL